MQRGLAGAVFLLMTEFSTLRIRLQLAELSLMELIYCCLRWQDGVEVVAVPFHPALVKILAMVHRHKVLVEEGTDTVYHGVPAHPGDSGDGAVAGMTGVRPAIFNQQQVGVDHKRRGWKLQQEHLIRQREKIRGFTIEHGSAFSTDESLDGQTAQILFHCGHCHMKVCCDGLRSRCDCGAAIAEIRKDYELEW